MLAAFVTRPVDADDDVKDLVSGFRAPCMALQHDKFGRIGLGLLILELDPALIVAGDTTLEGTAPLRGTAV